MSEWDDLADMVERPAKEKPRAGSLRTSIKNAVAFRNSGTIAHRVAASRHKPIVVSLAKLNLPDLPSE